MPRVKMLGAVCSGRDNNLNLIRMLAATAVVVSHAWMITIGPNAAQPLSQLVGKSLGTLSVYVFFCISGFLIARSFERQPTLRHWLMARGLRLFPALAVVLVLSVLVLGPATTDLPLGAYFADADTYIYIVHNLTLVFEQEGLPGVFESQPMPAVVNGPLWTLFFEVLCYGGVLFLGLIGALRDRRLFLFCAAVAAASYLAVASLPQEAVNWRLSVATSFGLPFAIGVCFYLFRERVRLDPVILAGLAAASVASARTALFEPIMVLCLCYGVFVVAYVPGGFIRQWNRLGDYSYGTYIYGWPVQQTLVFFVGAMHPLMNIALAMPITLMLAWLSWVLVEKPALSLVPHSVPLAGSSEAAPSAPSRVDLEPAPSVSLLGAKSELSPGGSQGNRI